MIQGLYMDWITTWQLLCSLLTPHFPAGHCCNFPSTASLYEKRAQPRAYGLLVVASASAPRPLTPAFARFCSSFSKSRSKFLQKRPPKSGSGASDGLHGLGGRFEIPLGGKAGSFAWINKVKGRPVCEYVTHSQVFSKTNVTPFWLQPPPSASSFLWKIIWGHKLFALGFNVIPMRSVMCMFTANPSLA